MANRVVEILVDIKGGAVAAFGALKNSIMSVSSAVMSLKGLLVGLAGAAIVKTVEGLVSAFAAQETVVNRLNAALRVSGRFTQEASDHIQAMADRMRETTIHSDEEALAVSATFASMAKELTAEQLAEAQKIAIGFADATGRSVEGAAQLIVRSISGQGNALKRYGIDLDNAGSQQEKFNQVAQKLGPMFAISESSAKTLAGGIAQAKNEFGEIREVLGETIARFLGVNEKTNTLRDTFRRWREEIKEHAPEWIRYGQAVIQAFGVIAAGIDAFVTLLVGVIRGIFVTIVDGNMAMMEGLKVILFGAWEGIKALMIAGINKAVIEPIDTMLELADRVAQKFGKKIEFRIGQIDNANPFVNTKQALDNLQGRVGRIGEEWKNQFAIARDAVQGVGDRMGRVRAELDKPLIPLTGGRTAGEGANLGAIVDETAAETMRRIAEEQKLLQAQYKAGVITQAEFVRGIAEQEAQLRKLIPAVEGNREEMVQLFGLLAKVKDIRVDNMLAQAGRLKEAFASGKIGVKEYDSAIESLVRDLEKLLAAAGLTEEQIRAVTKAIREGKTEMKGIGPQLEKAFGLGEGQGGQALAAANEELAKMAVGIGTAFADAVGQALTAGGNFGKVVAAAVGDAAKSFAKLAIGRSLMELAEGIAASFVPGKQAEAAGHFAAAKTFAGAAVFMGGLGAALSPGRGGGGGGAGAAGAAAAAGRADTKGSATIIIEGGLLDMSNPEQAEAFRKAVEDLTDREVMIR